MTREYICKINIDERNPHVRHATFQPEGFWSRDAIRISQDTEIWDLKWDSPRMSWGSGGTDGSLSEIETAESFVAGLFEAIKIAKEWDKDTGKPAQGEGKEGG